MTLKEIESQTMKAQRVFSLHLRQLDMGPMKVVFRCWWHGKELYGQIVMSNGDKIYHLGKMMNDGRICTIEPAVVVN